MDQARVGDVIPRSTPSFASLFTEQSALPTNPPSINQSYHHFLWFLSTSLSCLRFLPLFHASVFCLLIRSADWWPACLSVSHSFSAGRSTHHWALSICAAIFLLRCCRGPLAFVCLFGYLGDGLWLERLFPLLDLGAVSFALLSSLRVFLLLLIFIHSFIFLILFFCLFVFVVFWVLIHTAHQVSLLQKWLILNPNTATLPWSANRK